MFISRLLPVPVPLAFPAYLLVSKKSSQATLKYSSAAIDFNALDVMHLSLGRYERKIARFQISYMISWFPSRLGNMGIRMGMRPILVGCTVQNIPFY